MQDTSFSDPHPTLPVAATAPPLVSRIEQAWPADQWRRVHVLLAVSGGADSVALLRAMLDLKQQHGGSGQLHVGHLHHGLRGAEADDDQRWVDELCRSLGVRLWTNRAEIAGSDTREGWEAAARSARYEFLARTAGQIGARFVVTAHTADDQAETVLHRILRGTGIEGLAGIPDTRPLTQSATLVRPMLSVTRVDVIAYLDGLQQNFRTDSSNANSCFTRNWLRNELLPIIRGELNPDVGAALCRLSQQAGEMQHVLLERADRLLAENVKFAMNASNGEAGEIRISQIGLCEQPSLAIRELCKRAWQQAGWPLREMGYDEWQQLAELALSGNKPAIMLPGAVRADVRDGVLVLHRADPR